MRCLICGEEMHLMQVVQDNTMLVSGYEHHTWQCSNCSEIERRLVFIREKTPADKIQVEPAHPEPPAAKLQTTAWIRALEKLRSTQTELNEQAASASSSVRPPRRPESARPVTARIPSGPAATAHDDAYAPPSAWTRAIAKFRKRQEQGL